MKRITLAEWNDELIEALRRVGWLQPHQKGPLAGFVFGRVFVEMKKPERRKRGQTLRVDFLDPDTRRQPKYQQQLIDALVKGLKWNTANARMWVDLTMQMTAPDVRWTPQTGRKPTPAPKVEELSNKLKAAGRGNYGFMPALGELAGGSSVELEISDRQIRRRRYAPKRAKPAVAKPRRLVRSPITGEFVLKRRRTAKKLRG